MPFYDIPGGIVKNSRKKLNRIYRIKNRINRIS
jgi:hypothetical protein